MDIIKELKENEKPFDLMSEEMQAAVLEFKFADLEWYTYGGTSNPHWETPSTGPAGSRITSYRLRPDYEEDEVVKCEVFKTMGNLMFRHDIGNGGKQGIVLSRAVDYDDFVGFLYEDGSVCAWPRRYDAGGLTLDLFKVEGLGFGTTVLTPTHVLFRSK